MDQRTGTPTPDRAAAGAGRTPPGDGAGRPQHKGHDTAHREALPPADERALTASVNAILNRQPTVGLAVGVVRDGVLAFFNAHGLADIATQTPITQDTVFRIGSITKTVTAIAVMQLWEQGLIDLDAIRIKLRIDQESPFGMLRV